MNTIDADAVQTSEGRSWDYGNIAFLTLTPIVALLGTAYYAWHYGVSWLDVAIFAAMYLATGLSITAGYHRYYAHKSYECGRFLQLFYLIFGAAAVENSVLHWASDHRDHHRFVDQDEDPYSILKGGLYAHMGWIFYKDTRSLHQRCKNVPDLLKDPFVRWQERWYLFLVVAASFGLPTLLGFLGGRPLGGLLWGGFLRVVVVHHMTFLINSAAHLWGKRSYSLDNSARDNWALAPLTFGEGYHNFHHKFPADWRNGIRWYQFDIGKWWLFAMKSAGLASRLKRTPEPIILKAKLEVDILSAKEKLLQVKTHQALGERAHRALEAGRRRLESAMERYHYARVNYLRMKRTWSRAMRREIARDIDLGRTELKEARQTWAAMMRAVNRFSYSGARSLVTLAALADIVHR